MVHLILRINLGTRRWRQNTFLTPTVATWWTININLYRLGVQFIVIFNFILIDILDKLTSRLKTFLVKGAASLDAAPVT